MQWAKNNDMERRFGLMELCAVAQPLNPCPVTSDTGDVYDFDRVTLALEDAQSEAESYIATRYALPLCVPEGKAFPRMLTNAVCDMALYRLTVGSALETDAITRRYEEAVRLLRDVSKGVADVPFLCTSADTSAAGSMGVEIHPGAYDDFFTKRFTEVV